MSRKSKTSAELLTHRMTVGDRFTCGCTTFTCSSADSTVGRCVARVTAVGDDGTVCYHWEDEDKTHVQRADLSAVPLLLARLVKPGSRRKL